MRPNWFVGLPVSAGAWFPARLPAPPAATRLFHPEDLHLTVAFLGGCSEAAALEVWEEARRTTGAAGPATLGDVVPMGPRRRPSALSATLDQGRERITDYLAAHRDRWLTLARSRPETRPPVPHCTLARPTRKATDRERWEAVRWAAGLELAGLAVTVGPAALYTWAPDRRERLFQIVDRASG